MTFGPTDPGVTGQPSATGETFDAKMVTKRLRNAIAKGDTDRVRKIARNFNLKPRDTKALLAITEKNAPKDFLGRLVEDVKTTVAGTAKGLPGMAADIGKELVALPRLELQKLKGEDVSAGDYARAIPLLGTGISSTVGFFDNKSNELTPFSSQIGQSFRNSYERLIHPTRLAREYSQRPFSTLVEDVGNVAAVLGPAGKAVGLAGEAAGRGAQAAGVAGNVARETQLAARAAQLGAISNRLGQVSRAADIMADTPFLPVSAPARSLNTLLTGNANIGRGISRVLPARTQEFLRAGGVSGAPSTRRLMETLKLAPEQRAVKRILRDSSETRAFTADDIANEFQAQERLLPNLDEQRAAFLVGQGQAQALSRLRDVLPEAQFEAFVYDQLQPQGALGPGFTPEAVRMATDAVSGRNPDLGNRIDQALAAGAPGRAERLRGYLSRGGRGRAEQVGYRPLTGVIEERTARLRRRVNAAQQILDRRERTARNAEQVAESQAQRAYNLRNRQRNRLLPLQQQQNMLRAYRARIAPQIAQMRRTLIDLRRDARNAGIEYQARRDQYQTALRTDPNSPTVARMRQEVLDSYQRYSDLLTQRTALDRQIRQMVSTIPTVRGRIVVPREVTIEQVRRSLPSTGRARVLRTQANNAARRLGTQQRNLSRTTTETAASVEAAPARLRPVLEVNRAVNNTLRTQSADLRRQGLDAQADLLDQAAADIPETLQMLRRNGINVDHFINPRTMNRAGFTTPQGELMLPRITRLNEGRRRTRRGLEYDMTLQAQAQAEIIRANQLIELDTMRRIADLPFMRRGSDLAQMVDANGNPMFPMMQGPNARFPSRSELNAAGLDVWDPSSIFGSRELANADSIIAPQPIVRAFRNYYKPGGVGQTIMRYTLDPATRIFKIIVLPLSPAWNVGNFVTNAFMATFVAGIDPITLTRNIGRAMQIRRQTGEWPGERRLYSSGSTFETADFLFGRNRGREGPIRRAIRAPARLGFGVNQAVDNMYRAAVYLTRERRFTPEQATKMALRAMGDFTNLSPFERNVVRRVIPFYSWLRHMTQIVVRLPIEHPYRTAWILSMSNVFRDSEPWEDLLPSFMRGFLPLGGDTTLGVQNFMPFSNPLAITKLPQNLNPILKLGLVNIPGSPLYGRNPLTGRDYTRPPGTGRYDEFGRPLGTPPSLLEQLRQISPQIRMIDAASGRKNIARYETGDPIRVRGENGKLKYIEVPQESSRWITRFLGIPTSSKKTLKQIADTIIARQVEAWKAANPQEELSTGKPNTGFGPTGL
jgi:hypothetical protein